MVASGKQARQGEFREPLFRQGALVFVSSSSYAALLRGEGLGDGTASCCSTIILRNTSYRRHARFVKLTSEPCVQVESWSDRTGARMMRWKKKIASAVMMLGGIGGCKQPLYMTADDHRAVTAAGLPRNIETDPNVASLPNVEGHLAPRDIDDPDRPPRYMTLSEAFAIALESGNRGSQNVSNALTTTGTGAGPVFGGRSSLLIADDLVNAQGGRFSSFNDDAIRAFALDPAISGADIEGALAKFDARWLSTMQWNKVDTASISALSNFSNGDTAAFSSGLYKPLPTGGLAGITFNTNYTKLSNPPTGFQVINPAYQPSLNFTFEQPLLQSYGIEMNQLLPTHPGSTQIAGFTATGGRSEGILVTRIRYEQQRAEFERDINVMLFNVENAYWALYANYFSLYANEQGLRQAYMTWQLKKSELEAGKTTAHELAQVRAQFANFRRQRIDSLQTVLESERQLRGLLGMKVEDNLRIVPADAPTLAPYKPDWTSSLSEALASRPELLMAREEVKVNQFNVMVQRNFTRPDLRAFASYNINSIGTQLDGSSSSNALAGLSDNKFNNWTLGLRLNVPIGTRDAHASTRVAELNLARSFIVLKNQELKAERFLAAVYQAITHYHRVIEATQERRRALAEQLRGLYARIQAGKDPLITILTAQSDFATALSDEYTAIANYNIAIAGLQYAKGTLKDYDNVRIADGPLPNCALVRATDHLRQRTEGLVARERAVPPMGDGPHPLPQLLENAPKTPDLPPDLVEPIGAPKASPERPFDTRMEMPKSVPPVGPLSTGQAPGQSPVNMIPNRPAPEAMQVVPPPDRPLSLPTGR